MRASNWLARASLLLWLALPAQRLPLHAVGLAAAPTGGLVESTNISWLGDVKFPQVGGTDRVGSAYGGSGLVFDPNGCSGGGSLFVTGYDNGLSEENAVRVEEVCVPTTWSTSATYASLPTMTLAHGGVGFVDVLAGHGNSAVGAGTTARAGGLYVNGSELLVPVYIYFDTLEPTRLSWFRASKNVTSPAYIGGPYEITTTGAGVSGGNPADCGSQHCREGVVAGHMLAIPAAYQSTLGGDILIGQCCLAIIGRSSHGPSFTRATLADIGSTTPVTGKVLLGYQGTGHFTLGSWDGTVTGTGQFVGGFGDQQGGSVWMPNSRSILVFQTLGTVANFCYGTPTSSGTASNFSPNNVVQVNGNTPTGSDASTDATGLIITVPNANLSISGADFIQLTNQSSPVVTNPTISGSNERKPGPYHGADGIFSKAGSGTPAAAVTVTHAFTSNLTGQAYVIGDAACYDPTQVNVAGGATTGGKGPTSYPYIHNVYAYDASDLAAVNAGTKHMYEPVPYDTWDYSLSIIYNGKHTWGGAAYDTINDRLYVVQKGMGANNEIALAVFSYTAPAPVPSPVPANALWWLGAAVLGVAALRRP